MWRVEEKGRGTARIEQERTFSKQVRCVEFVEVRYVVLLLFQTEL